MSITIIGSGNMARGISVRALASGIHVTLIGREPGKAATLASELQSAVQNGASVQAAAEGASITDEIVVLAVPYPAAIAVVQQYGDQLTGKIIVDITNPVDFATMSSALPADTSGAEEIAQATPEGAKVVKALNTVFAGTLLSGQVAGQPLDVFIAGDDPNAKAAVSEFLNNCGLRAVDAGALHRARQLEALGLLHIALQVTRNTGFNTSLKLLS